MHDRPDRPAKIVDEPEDLRRLIGLMNDGYRARCVRDLHRPAREARHLLRHFLVRHGTPDRDVENAAAAMLQRLADYLNDVVDVNVAAPLLSSAKQCDASVLERRTHKAVRSVGVVRIPGSIYRRQPEHADGDLLAFKLRAKKHLPGDMRERIDVRRLARGILVQGNFARIVDRIGAQVDKMRASGPFECRDYGLDHPQVGHQRAIVAAFAGLNGRGHDDRVVRPEKLAELRCFFEPSQVDLPAGNSAQRYLVPGAPRLKMRGHEAVRSEYHHPRWPRRRRAQMLQHCVACRDSA